MQLVTRAQWGAAPAKAEPADMPTANGVKVHWIGGPYTTPSDHSQCSAEVRSIQQEHLNNPTQGWVDIAYNFVVCQHGYVFEGRGLRKESGANGDQPLNKADYAVCAIQGTNENAQDALKSGLRDAIEYLQANGAGSEILGHRDGYNTDCPGDELYGWVHAGAPRPGQPAIPTPAPTPAPAPSGPAWPGVYLKNYTEDGAARQWQQRMADRGWSITVDGKYGPKSAAVCLAFQKEKGLQADGIVGPDTWNCAFRTDNVT